MRSLSFCEERPNSIRFNRAISRYRCRRARRLDLAPLHGVRCYGVIAVSTLVGVVLGFTRIDPIKAFYIGVISVPIMFVMMRMAANPKSWASSWPRSEGTGWATAAMAAAVAIMLAQMPFY